MPALDQAIAAAVPLLHEHCRDAWVVIGSAAAALAGANVEVGDLDLLTSVDDAEGLIALWHERLDGVYEPAAGDRFRSRFARFRFPGMPVEVMGGLELRETAGWQPIRVDEIVHVNCAGIPVPIPAAAEQIHILERFGRPKDLQRAELLRAL
ncbi:hypothetical protein ISN74_12420 [Dyella caseinilytica]|uniref:Nucleotidyltransferase-like protein n=2 Tax=Dyella caseinilytica TaxID=1849581 RepID=A0ABX7GZS2_9GAMM|nr:hypothetical protein ISN74_12420 [Dyella caseinilytica]